MLELNYTNQGPRPSAKQIIADWKKAARPNEFTVGYGETFAHFECVAAWGQTRWHAHGNGCSGIKRDQVERMLNEASGIED